MLPSGSAALFAFTAHALYLALDYVLRCVLLHVVGNLSKTAVIFSTLFSKMWYHVYQTKLLRQAGLCIIMIML